MRLPASRGAALSSPAQYFFTLLVFWPVLLALLSTKDAQGRPLGRWRWAVRCMTVDASRGCWFVLLDLGPTKWILMPSQFSPNGARLCGRDQMLTRSLPRRRVTGFFVGDGATQDGC
ncbi:uncharacterized protein PHACADRAFT_248875 [Phanerochaete carnosa HHB-10118-sp]|uniref:Uncharacterized protein n=1 Tax=Phanerochaete carnosa (strain HHB-10118-sp) TaxID=650164 RepID=K5WI71_PHACS|nr:uncharacterized protein PHACADRAFT_248875 [Phanerochaete carnosa HHB-10118-sp]EKM58784.1 hypothetical protein PHACADRAFT_248875 [Phanerochaete carnosa HHB-10118-sp]